MTSIATQTSLGRRRTPDVLRPSLSSSQHSKRGAQHGRCSSPSLSMRQSFTESLVSSSSKQKLAVPLAAQDIRALYRTRPEVLRNLSLTEIETLHQSAVRYQQCRELLAEEKRLRKNGMRPSKGLLAKLDRVHQEVEQREEDMRRNGHSPVTAILEGSTNRERRSSSFSPFSLRRRGHGHGVGDVGYVTVDELERDEQLRRESLILHAGRILLQTQAKLRLLVDSCQ